MSADGGARKDSRKDSNSAGGAQPHAAMQKPLYVLAPSPDPTPTGVYLPRSSEWGEPEEGAGAGVYSPGYGFPRVSPRLPPPLGVGDAGILNAETGEGAFCPLPVCPTPRGDVPTVQGMGIRPGYRHDCPRPPGRGRRPEAGRGGGC